MDCSEEPLYYEPDTCVCSMCVVDAELALLVKQNAVDNGKCDYCQNYHESGQYVAPFGVVMERIVEAILAEYGNAQDLDLPWEKGWLVDEVEPAYIVEEFDPGWNGKFSTAVLDALNPNVYWVEHGGSDWMLLNQREMLVFAWEAFKNQILYKTRYLFLSEPIDDMEEDQPDHIPISYTLDAIGEVCRDMGLASTLKAGTCFYRARASNRREKLSEYKDLGVCPAEHANSGRMNPAGIPYLYLSENAQTTIDEVRKWGRWVYIAQFKLIKDIQVLDFYNLPEVPSCFKQGAHIPRMKLSFLAQFRNEISLPISKDGMEHIEYVPTQVVSEFIRHRFKTGDGLPVDGVAYPSVKNETGINYAIFTSDIEEMQEFFELVDVVEIKFD